MVFKKVALFHKKKKKKKLKAHKPACAQTLVCYQGNTNKCNIIEAVKTVPFFSDGENLMQHQTKPITEYCIQ